MEHFHRKHITTKTHKNQESSTMVHIHRFLIPIFSPTMPQNHTEVP